MQWNLEGGSITDLSSNSSPSYFNFDSFEQIQVITGGGDVSVQSSGLSINLVTKSGSNVFKGTAVATFENDATQGNNVTRSCSTRARAACSRATRSRRSRSTRSSTAGRSCGTGCGGGRRPTSRTSTPASSTSSTRRKGSACQELVAAQKTGSAALRQAVTYDNLEQVQNCLSNDKTIIKDLEWKFNYQLNSANKIQYLFQSDNKYRNRRGASADDGPGSDDAADVRHAVGLPAPDALADAHLIVTDKLVFNNQFTYVDGGFFLDYQDVPPQGGSQQSRYIGIGELGATRRPGHCLFNTQPAVERRPASGAGRSTATYQTVRQSWEAKTDGTYFLTNMLGGDHSLKFGVGWRKNPILTFSHYSGGARASIQCVGNAAANCSGNYGPAGCGVGLRRPHARALSRPAAEQRLVDLQRLHPGRLQPRPAAPQRRAPLRLADVEVPGRLRAGEPDSAGSAAGAVRGGHRSVERARSEHRQPILDANGQPMTEKLPSFSNWAPRMSATYDLFGNGKTSVHASYSLYYQTKITLAELAWAACSLSPR